MTTAPSPALTSPNAPAVAALWLTPPGVLVRSWSDDDVGVAYDARHARTHLLSAAACDVLRRCRAEPLSLSAMARDAQTDFEWVLATVTALEVAGLLQRDSPHQAAVLA